MKRHARIESRIFHAKESFKSAAEAIGDIESGMHVFSLTRGQWSMIDAILHCMDELGSGLTISLWTWTIAEYEVQVFERLMLDSRIEKATLIIDGGARTKNANLISRWRKSFGDESVKYVLNHAKIATIESPCGKKLLLRGSMNLNFNPRFEQFDLTEGCDGFDLVRGVESDLPVLADDCDGADIYAASKVSNAFDQEQLDIFGRVKVWAK